MKFIRVKIEVCEIPDNELPSGSNGVTFGTFAILPFIEALDNFWSLDKSVRDSLIPFGYKN